MEHRISILFYVRKSQNDQGQTRSYLHSNYRKWSKIRADITVVGEYIGFEVDGIGGLGKYYRNQVFSIGLMQ